MEEKKINGKTDLGGKIPGEGGIYERIIRKKVEGMREAERMEGLQEGRIRKKCGREERIPEEWRD